MYVPLKTLYGLIGVSWGVCLTYAELQVYPEEDVFPWRGVDLGAQFLVYLVMIPVGLCWLRHKGDAVSEIVAERLIWTGKKTMGGAYCFSVELYVLLGDEAVYRVIFWVMDGCWYILAARSPLLEES